MRAAGLLPYTSFSTPVSCGNGIHVKRPLRAVSSFGWSSFHMPRFPQTGDGIWWAVEGDGGVPGGRPHATPLAAATDRPTDRPTDPAGAGPPLGHGRGRPPPPRPVCLFGPPPRRPAELESDGGTTRRMCSDGRPSYCSARPPPASPGAKVSGTAKLSPHSSPCLGLESLPGASGGPSTASSGEVESFCFTCC